MNSDTTEDVPIPGARHRHDEAGLVPAFTLVVWVGCVAIGVTGLLTKPGPTPTPASQPTAQLVSVMLEAEPTPDPPAAKAAKAAPAETVDPGPALPSIPTAALPSPAIAFAVPVAGPARIVPAARAVPVARRAGTPVGLVARQLVLGRGDGDQPKPDYPAEARHAGQQGVVTVRLSVDADGRVTNAWAVGPSPFPSLNRAAVDAVRDTWHFPAGPPQLYDVQINFQGNPSEE